MRGHHLQRISVMAALTIAALGSPVLGSGSADPRADFAAAETAAFTEADTDGDGTLTLDEFTKFNELLRQKLDALRFNRLDTNGDGVLSKDELDAGRPMGPGPMGAGGPPPGPGF